MRTLYSLCCVTMATVAVVIIAAPIDKRARVNLETLDKYLVRVKRAEEIMFGNHQNAARLKKSVVPADHGISQSTVNEIASNRPNVDETSASQSADSQASVNPADEPDVNSSNLAENDVEPMGEGGEAQEESDGHSETQVDEDGQQQTTDNTDVEVSDSSDVSDEVGRRKRAATSVRRSVRSGQARLSGVVMTAEHMTGADNNNNNALRSKRDLNTDDYIRELIGEVNQRTSNNMEDDGDDVPDDIDDNDVVDDYADSAADDDDDVDDYEEQNDDTSNDLASAYDALLSDRTKRQSDGALYRYLETLPDQPDPRVQPDPEWQDDEEDGESAVDYDATLPAAMAKRSFYPFRYEPYVRWSAMVPGQKKRSTAEARARLFRLAEALAANDRK